MKSGRKKDFKKGGIAELDKLKDLKKTSCFPTKLCFHSILLKIHLILISMDKLGLELGKNFLKSQFGGGSSSSGGSSSHRGGGGSGGRMTNSEFMREAKKFASSKGIKK